MKKTWEEIEQIAEVVVDAMLKVHRALGPGLLESAYQAGSVILLRALRAFAVNSLHTDGASTTLKANVTVRAALDRR